MVAPEVSVAAAVMLLVQFCKYYCIIDNDLYLFFLKLLLWLLNSVCTFIHLSRYPCFYMRDKYISCHVRQNAHSNTEDVFRAS